MRLALQTLGARASEGKGARTANPRTPYATASVAVGIMKNFVQIVLCTVLVPASWAAPGSVELSPARPASQQEYWAQVDRKDWSAAVTAATKLVEDARPDAQTEPLELVQALSLLGNAQLNHRDFIAAQAAFGEALKLAEQHEGPASRHTLDPLKGLGFTHAARGEHDQALPYLDRALLISHRTHGLFYSGQQSILKQLANSLTHTGQALDAERHVNYMLQVGERTYGENNPKLVPLICSVGDWYAEIGIFDLARRHYREAIKLVEKQLGRKDLALVLPLRRLAQSYVQELLFDANGFLDPYEVAEPDKATQWKLERPGNPRYLEVDGQKALIRSVSLLKGHPDAQPEQLVEALVDLGDWYQVKQEPNKALTYYREAAQLYPTIADANASAMPDPFTFPVRLYYPIPGTIVRSNRLLPDESEEVFVQMQFTVTAEGIVKDAKIIESNAYSRRASEILTSMKAARFRPKFEKGEPVETTAVDFREVFRTRKKAEPESDDPS